jgi:hypothetical protein
MGNTLLTYQELGRQTRALIRERFPWVTEADLAAAETMGRESGVILGLMDEGDPRARLKASEVDHG